MHCQMNNSTPRTRSFVFDIDDDGIITDVDCDPQTPDAKLTLDVALSSGTYQIVSWRDKEDVLPLFGRSDLPAPPGRLNRPSRPPPLANVFLARCSTSSWFDDTPTREVSSIEAEKTSSGQWDVPLEWLDDSEIPVDIFGYESDNTSTFTFGRDGSTSSSPTFGSRGSSTMVPTEIDDESIMSSKLRALDTLDEQLLSSPIESFAALCWKSMVPDGRRMSVSVPELRFSRLYGDAARDYEDYHWKEYEDAESLPHMQFSADFVPRDVPQEAIPWTYHADRTIPILDLLGDAPTLATKEKTFTTYSELSPRHRSRQGSLGTLARKCKRAMGCLSGINGKTA